jgi:amino acid permease
VPVARSSGRLGGGIHRVARKQSGVTTVEGVPQLDEKPKVRLSSASATSVNIVKNLLGAGMLSLPGGVAAFNGSPQAVLPATVLVVLLGLLSAYGFILIADACERTGESTYQGAWARIMSPNTSWIPLAACMMKAGLGCVAFEMILGDCLPMILSPLGLPAVFTSRNFIILAVTFTILGPLCRMKSLAPLAKFSVLGVLSNVYIVCFMILRCFDGSYRPGGALLRNGAAIPQFAPATQSMWEICTDPKILVFVSMLSTAYLAHYNSPIFYQQLAPGPDGEKKRRFEKVCVSSFLGAVCFFATVMVTGFLTFGSSCHGLILNQYSAADKLAFLARVAIALSLITSYPLVFASVKQQFVSLLGAKGEEMSAKQPDVITAVLLTGITVMALYLRNLGKVVAVGGALFANFLIYIAPAVMVLRAEQKSMGSKERSSPLSRAFQMGMIPLGCILGGIGMMQSLK